MAKRQQRKGPKKARPRRTSGPKWLVMVYMQASDTSQLDNLAVLDLAEMEEGVQQNADVQVLVQVKRRWPAVPQRYLLRSPALPAVIGGPVAKKELDDVLNMGKRKALSSFLSEGLKIGSRYGASKYCLVLWGHAFGLGFGRDHGDALQLAELQGALKKFKQERKRKPLDILVTNSCTMSYIEAAYELREDVEYLAASQVFVPLKGLPYREILTGIHSEMSPGELGEMIVDRYVDDFRNSPTGERVAMALLHLKEAKDFAERLRTIAATLTQLIGSGHKTDFERLSEIQDAFFVNPAGDVRPVLDLRALGQDLLDLSDDSAMPSATPAAERREASSSNRTTKAQRSRQRLLTKLRRQADGLATAINGTSLTSLAGVRRPGAVLAQPGASNSTGLVAYHRKHADLHELHGIGVFAPFVVERHVRERLELDDSGKTHDELEGRKAYEGLKIFGGNAGRKARGWPQLVYERLSREEPDEIVDATGVVRPAERGQVNQLLVAVEAAFNRLDRTLRLAEGPLAKEVAGNRGNTVRANEILAGFGPPNLKLAGDLSLADPERFKVSKRNNSSDSQKVAARGAGDGRAPNRHELVVPTLQKIECALHLVEKTIKRVVTNRTFGLGPPNSGASTVLHLGGPKEAGEVFGGPKEAGEVFGGPKEAGEVFGGPKEAGEVFGGPKEAGEVFGPLGSEIGARLAFLSANAQAAGLAVSALFAQVASLLMQLEQAAAAIESAAARFLFAPAHGARLSEEDYVKSVGVRFAQTFGVMREVSLQARRGIRRVLSHPLYGLGPGPEGLQQEERDELAAAAGLNRRNLLLLGDPQLFRDRER